MGEGDFRPPTAPRPINRFSWKLKYTTNSRKRPRMQNFSELCRRGWSGQIASLTHESFCLVFLSLSRPQAAYLDTSPGSIRQYASFPPMKCLLGVRIMKFEIWPLYLHNTWKLRHLAGDQWKFVIVIGKPYTSQIWHRCWPPKWHHVTSKRSWSRNVFS